MAKMQIVKIGVHNIEYKGRNMPALRKGVNYVAVIVEGFVGDRTEVVLEFKNGTQDRMIYDSFVSFAQDWNILSEFKFKDCYIPDRAG